MGDTLSEKWPSFSYNSKVREDKMCKTEKSQKQSVTMFGSTVRNKEVPAFVVTEDIPTQGPTGLQVLEPPVITGDIGQ